MLQCSCSLQLHEEELCGDLWGNISNQTDVMEPEKRYRSDPQSVGGTGKRTESRLLLCAACHFPAPVTVSVKRMALSTEMTCSTFCMTPCWGFCLPLPSLLSIAPENNNLHNITTDTAASSTPQRHAENDSCLQKMSEGEKKKPDLNNVMLPLQTCVGLPPLAFQQGLSKGFRQGRGRGEGGVGG